jgi:hypothetical protein
MMCVCPANVYNLINSSFWLIFLLQIKVGLEFFLLVVVIDYLLGPEFFYDEQKFIFPRNTIFLLCYIKLL